MNYWQHVQEGVQGHIEHHPYKKMYRVVWRVFPQTVTLYGIGITEEKALMMAGRALLAGLPD